MTASSARENSYAWYFDEFYETYLGDEFSIRMLEYLDTIESNNAMLHHEFAAVRTSVVLSHVQEYGNLALGRLMVKEFLREIKVDPESVASQNSQYKINNKMSAVTFADVPLEIMKRKLELAETEEDRLAIQEQINQILQERLTIDNVIQNIVSEMCGNDEIKNASFSKTLTRITRDNMFCFKQITKAFSENCFNVSENEYAKSVLNRVVKACSIDWITPDEAVNAIVSVCSNIQ